MREILFRGKRIDNGEWVYGDLIQYEPIPCIRPINQDLGESYDYDEIEVDNKTIGQLTGLTDKNGVKIFEGDYIGWFDNKEKIEYFKYANDGLLKKVNKYGEFSLTTAEIYNNNHLEIIGNIHE